MRIRALIFDLGGVVVDWNPRAVVRAFSPDAQLHEALFEASFGHPDWAALDRGSIDEATAMARMQARLPLASGEYARLMRMADDSLLPLPETVALLHDLAKTGLALYALSNMPSARFRMLEERHDFWPLFRDVVISGEVGLLKPEAAIFEHALAKFQLAPQEAVFIDDHLPNVEAARRLGLSALCFGDAAKCRADLQALFEAE